MIYSQTPVAASEAYNDQIIFPVGPTCPLERSASDPGASRFDPTDIPSLPITLGRKSILPFYDHIYFEPRLDTLKVLPYSLLVSNFDRSQFFSSLMHTLNLQKRLGLEKDLNSNKTRIIALFSYATSNKTSICGLRNRISLF